MRIFSRFKFSFISFVAFFILLIWLSLLVYYMRFSDTKCSSSSQPIISTTHDNLPTIYVITPTYARHVQKAELTRLSHTLLLVPKLHWILVEDSEIKSSLVSKLLTSLNHRHDYMHTSFHPSITWTHLNVATPKDYKMKSSDPNWLKPRGVLQRNVALDWLRQNSHLIHTNGVVYFADDDNTYDLKLFDEMRSTNKVSIWPVGLVGGLLVEKPIVENGVVVGWNTLWKPNREFAIDMAGFAIKLKLLLQHPNALFSLNVQRGYQETHLLKQLISGKSELEPKANNCAEILVWHTRTEVPKLRQEKKLNVPSNQGMEL